MKNAKMSVKGDILTIEVDLSQRNGLSGSGKTVIIASTEGSTKLDGDHAQVSVGLNVYTKDLSVTNTAEKPKGKGK
jgi:hypothetical protein